MRRFRVSLADVSAGFSVSLIALPLCLGISLASGFPATAGLVTAIIGGLVCSLISKSELTIKGPAAGLIVIALGAVTELGQGDMRKGYVLALGVAVIAGIIQIVFALLRLGKILDLVPPTPVHGMMAAIGVIIAAKQVHIMLGTTPVAKTPLSLIAEIPHSIANLNPEIAIIGLATIATLIVAERLRKKYPKIAPPLAGIAVAVVLGQIFDLAHDHTFALFGQAYAIGPKALLHVPASVLSALGRPDFSALTTPVGIKYIVMFSLVGTLESLLSARAVERLDPERRRSDLNRDLLAVGVANTLAAFAGGLPMISEIVRSSANVAAGAKSRQANFFHGLFLLAILALAAPLLEYIPLASLAALLVYTGVRLASPKQVGHLLELGAEQLVVFLVTVVMTLATDLLVGVASGIVCELVLLLLVFRVGITRLPRLQIETTKKSELLFELKPIGAITFANRNALRSLLVAMPKKSRAVVDLSAVTLVDHAGMALLRGWNEERAPDDVELVLDNSRELRPLAKSELGLHRRGA